MLDTNLISNSYEKADNWNDFFNNIKKSFDLTEEFESNTTKTIIFKSNKIYSFEIYAEIEYTNNNLKYLYFHSNVDIPLIYCAFFNKNHFFKIDTYDPYCIADINLEYGLANIDYLKQYFNIPFFCGWNEKRYLHNNDVVSVDISIDKLNFKKRILCFNSYKLLSLSLFKRASLLFSLYISNSLNIELKIAHPMLYDKH